MYGKRKEEEEEEEGGTTIIDVNNSNDNGGDSSSIGDLNSFSMLKNPFAANLFKSFFTSATTQVTSSFSNTGSDNTGVVTSALSNYFSINEKQVLSRLQSTVYKPFTSMEDAWRKPDLYTPIMLCFSMTILLTFLLKSPKTANVAVGQDNFPGTLMMIALGNVFTYWALLSVLLYSACRMLSTAENGLVSILSVVGYSMFPVMVIVVVSYLFSSNWLFFLLLWFTIGLVSGLNLGRTFSVRTPNNSSLLLLSIVMIHMLFILYIRYAYVA